MRFSPLYEVPRVTFPETISLEGICSIKQIYKDETGLVRGWYVVIIYDKPYQLFLDYDEIIAQKMRKDILNAWEDYLITKIKSAPGYKQENPNKEGDSLEFLKELLSSAEKRLDSFIATKNYETKFPGYRCFMEEEIIAIKHRIFIRASQLNKFHGTSL